MKRFVYIFILLICFACTTQLNREELIAYITNPEHGLTQEKTVNGIKVKLTYRPSGLVALQEIQANNKLTPAQADSIMAHYNQYLYFVLSISKYGKEVLSYYENQQQFGGMVSQLSFGMGNNLVLTNQNRDTLHLLDAHAPRTFGMAAATDILLIYDKEDINNTDYISLLYKDIGLGTGNLRFKVQTKHIKNAPGLKLTEENK